MPQQTGFGPFGILDSDILLCAVLSHLQAAHQQDIDDLYV